ncbi:MAG: hypothetical protein LKF01_01010 [Lactobacillus sp.]|nr:hypothetical protein [Lactobacillus sp.]MCH3906650.1 hypothetical protein [Lactobacillus sp.]MCH3989714.1 hypothetical protein [Lactobacillus sp.]MCH4068120.1 hypothetical protein [Lactobacillus sp.]MCI1304301.1 hypothetical protein [Lactobacillus sp.]
MLSLLLLAASVWLLVKILSASIWTVLAWIFVIALIWALVAYLVLPVLAIALIGGGAYWLVRKFV